MDDLTTARQERLLTALADAPFDAYLAASPANVDHATGYRSVAGELFRQHQMAALVSPDATTLVCPVADSGPAIDRGIDGDELVCFGRFYFEATSPSATPPRLVDQHDGLPSAIRTAFSRRAAPGTVGVDVAGLGASWPAVREALPTGTQVVDASSWSKQVRAIKLAPEVELLRRAAALAEDGIDHAIATAAVDVTEQELANVVAQVMVAGGATPRFVVVTSGERSALADAAPTARRLSPGDLLRFDVGCVLDGYWSDVGRTAVVGEPTSLQARRYDAIHAGEQAQLEQARPGRNARELFDLAVEIVEGRGLSPYRRHHCGHGIGSEVYEPPIIAPQVEVPLAAGMTFCFETPYYELGWGGMMVEDTVVITESGCEMLTRSDRTLRVIPT